MQFYQNKTVLITGASSGIGLEFANQLNQLGARLILTARSENTLNEVASGFTDAAVIPGDLSDKSFPSILYQEIKNRNLDVDILVNNAGFGSGGKFLKADLDIYEKMVQVNITALTQLSHLFISDMVNRGSGGIINVASVAAYQPVPFMNVYSASKAYVKSFSLALSNEYKNKGIVVTAVCPGYTKTNFHAAAKMSPDPVGRKMQPDTVVHQALKAHSQRNNLIINGLMNKILAHSNRFVPTNLALTITHRLMKHV